MQLRQIKITEVLVRQARTHLRTPNRDALVLGLPEAQVVTPFFVPTIVTNPDANNDHRVRRERPLRSPGRLGLVMLSHVHPQFQNTKVVDTVAKKVLRASIPDGSVELGTAVHHGAQTVELMAQTRVRRRGNLAMQ